VAHNLPDRPGPEERLGSPDPVGGILRPRWRDRAVLRAMFGLIFVIGVFVVAPVVAMLMMSH